jgi:hypothetical protein
MSAVTAIGSTPCLDAGSLRTAIRRVLCMKSVHSTRTSDAHSNCLPDCPAGAINVQPGRSGRDGAADSRRPQRRAFRIPALDDAKGSSPAGAVSFERQSRAFNSGWHPRELMSATAPARSGAVRLADPARNNGRGSCTANTPRTSLSKVSKSRQTREHHRCPIAAWLILILWNSDALPTSPLLRAPGPRERADEADIRQISLSTADRIEQQKRKRNG